MQYRYLALSGREYHLSTRMIRDAAQRHAAFCDGREVGRGFASADDALERAIEHARNLDKGSDDTTWGA